MNNQVTIFIADDDTNITDLLTAFLTKEGYLVQAFHDGESLLQACAESLPDLVILDIMLPGIDGLSVCSTLKHQYPALLVVIISARDNSYDRVTGFSLGCDDYVIKPFLPLELVFRVRSLLKHSGESAAKEASGADPTLSFGPLVLYQDSRTAKLKDEPFPLSPTEFDFLTYLIKNKGAAVKREELLSNIWGVSWDANTRVADDLVKRLRRKFRSTDCPIRIETVWGYGFRITHGENENANTN